MSIYKRIKIGLWSLFLFFLFSPFFMQRAGLAQVPITPQPAIPAERVAQQDPFKEKISLDYKDADISSIIRSLSYTYGLNLVTSGDVKGKITVSLKDVTLAEALDVILTANGYNYTHKGNIIYITPGSAEGAQLVSEPVTLEYLKAGDAQNLLRKVLSPKGDIKVDEMFNILVVTDYPASIQKLKELLKSVDQAPQQVLIEAKIVDITSKDLQNLGVTWQVDYNPLHGLWSRDVDYAERAKGTGTFGGPSSSLSGGQIKIDTFVLKGLTATATLDALIQDQKANLLAAPSIAVINNREARIIIGEKVPYKERTQTTTGTTETTKFIDVGTALRVTPSINEDGYITMAIHPEVSSVKALLDAGPQITTREADTMVRVKEGETVVIGGLIKQEDNRVKSRMPVLGYIPFVSYLFGNQSKDQTQQELTVFITPKILRSREEMLARGKKHYEDEAVINITTTGSLNAQKELMDKANNLDAAVGLEARRKEDWVLKNQAVSIYESVLSQFPDGPMAPEAGFRAARIYFNDLNESYRARELCAVVISNYPNSPFAFHSRELYKKIVTTLENERLQKLKKSGRKEYYEEKDKEKAIENTIDKALDKEKVEDARKAREEARSKAEEEHQQLLAKRDQERQAKLEAQRKAAEERKAKEEEARKAKEEQQKLAREKAEAERQAKEEAQRKAEEERQQLLTQREKERLAKEEARQKELEERKKYQEQARIAREEEKRIAREKAEAERVAKEEANTQKLEAQRKAAEERKAKAEEARKAREEEQKIAREKSEAERAAKEEARQRALEEKKKEQQELIAARNKAAEDARLAKEEARRKAEQERQAKLEAQSKAKEKSDEIRKVEAELKAQEREKVRLAKLEARRKAEEERRLALAKKEQERQAKLEARRKAREEAKLAKEEARKRAEEIKQIKVEAETEAREKSKQAKLEAEEKAKQKTQEIEIEALQRQISRE